MPKRKDSETSAKGKLTLPVDTTSLGPLFGRSDLPPLPPEVLKPARRLSKGDFSAERFGPDTLRLLSARPENELRELVKGMKGHLDTLPKRPKWIREAHKERIGQVETVLATILAESQIPSSTLTEQTADIGNRRRIDAFILKVSTYQKITRTDIWTVAGYKNATEFERFQRGAQRTTRSAARNFNRVLNMTPEEFIENLNAKRPQK